MQCCQNVWKLTYWLCDFEIGATSQYSRHGSTPIYLSYQSCWASWHGRYFTPKDSSGNCCPVCPFLVPHLIGTIPNVLSMSMYGKDGHHHEHVHMHVHEANYHYRMHVLVNMHKVDRFVSSCGLAPNFWHYNSRAPPLSRMQKKIQFSLKQIERPRRVAY